MFKKYNEVLSLDKKFSPYYRLNDERKGYWNQFITTKQFYNLLDSFLNVLESQKPSERKSIWLHGTYGTGKSHATGVIKNLFYLDPNEITNFVNKFKREDLKARLYKFRKENRVFPIVMYGLQGITNQWDMSIEIEKSVRKCIKEEYPNITIKTDFEVYVDTIESDKSNYWEMTIKSEPRINELVSDKKELIESLKNHNKDVLSALRKVLNKKHRPITVPNITSWLKKVASEMKRKTESNKIVIYWDEFTSVMDMNNSGMNNIIQSIAELSESEDIFLYLISHRTQRQGIDRDDRKHILDRFIDLDYKMSDITTYQLINGAINKTNKKLWNNEYNKHKNGLEKVYNKINEYENKDIRESLEDLFPIHPFTAFVSSLIAREIGSTERSIFKFLNDHNKGFLNFINEHPNKGKTFVTPEYIFDFFREDFEHETESFYDSILNKYRSFKSDNEKYKILFKGLLLLNISHRLVNITDDNIEILIPNKNNLELMFKGSGIEKYIDGFLKYIQDKKIVFKDYQHRFIIEQSTLPNDEIKITKQKLKNKFDSVNNIFDKNLKNKIFKYCFNSHRRKDVTEVKLLDAKSKRNQILRRINKFKKGYSISIVLFIANDSSQKEKLKSTIENIDGESAQNIVFLILEKLFSKETRDNFLDNMARAEVSQKHHYSDMENKYNRNANQVIENWINDALNYSQITWMLYDYSNSLRRNITRYKDLPEELNLRISKIIFRHSFDGYSKKFNLLTAWQERLAKKTAEHFLQAEDLNELINLTNRGPLKITQNILKDKAGHFIVKDDLKIYNSDSSHPINIMKEKLKNKIDTGEKINFAESVKFLFGPPFGFYKCHIFLAALGFLIREYKGNLYNTSTGESCSTLKIKQMITDTFRYHCDNKKNKDSLWVRLGSKHEENLVKLIKNIFEINECDSITDLRYKLHDKLDFPLWLYNYSKNLNNDDEVLIALNVINDNILNINENNFLDRQSLKDIYSEVENYRYELKELISTSNKNSNLKLNLYNNFFNDIEGFSNIDNGTEKVLKYLKENLQEDQIYWDKNKIESNVKTWLITQFSKNSNGEETYKEQRKGNIKTISDIGNITTVEKKEQIKSVKEKIDAFEGDLKNLLKHLVESRPDIVDEIFILIKKLG